MQVWFYSIASVIAVSLISLVGVFTLAFKKEFLSKITVFLVCFAVGGLFGDAFIHLLPASFEKLGSGLPTSLLIISGILIFFVLEKFLRWRHCHSQIDEGPHYHPVVAINLIGDSVHNFIDGMLIGASFLVSVPIGITTTMAIILHEIPQEIGDFAVLIHGGMDIRKALVFNFLTALTSVLGAVVSLIAGPYIQNYSNLLLPITAGGFIYIAGSDLIPELHSGCDIKVTQAFWQFAWIIAGIGVMVILLFLE